MNEDQIKALLATMLADYVPREEANKTAAFIRGLKESVDGMHANNPLDTLVTAGLLEKDATGQYKPKAASPVPAKKDVEPEWQAQIRQMQEQMQAKDRALAAEKTKREESELKSAVIQAFEKAGAVNATRDYVHVLGSVKRGEDGTFHTIKKDEFGVETNVPLDAAFGAFLKSNPELMKAAGHAGSGTPAGAVTGTPGQMSTESYMSTRAKALESGDIKVTF
jgi:hypothetical protein